MRRIGRRQFLLGASGAVLATTRAFGQPRPRRLAWLGAGRAGVTSPFLEAVRAGLREHGWEEGRNLAPLAEYWTSGTLAEAEQLARQMLATNPELVIVYGRDVNAVRNVRPSVPVVFAFSGDPVDAGIVQSLSRPGTNFTGISLLSLELAGKRIDLLRETVPRLRRLGVLARPEHPGEPRERAISEEVARRGDLAMAMEGAHGMLYKTDAYDDGFWQQQFLGQWGIRIGGGTEQVQRNIIGERVLGLPPEPRPDKTEPFREVPKNA